MNDVWTGSISTDDPTVAIRDIQIWSTSTLGQSLLDRSAKLQFLSLVHVPSIPLYLAAGPSLDVSTDDKSTATWLNQSLMEVSGQEGQENASRESWWTRRGRQSEQGILLKVEEEGLNRGVSNQITEILLYAAVNTGELSLPSPASSSPALAGDNFQDDGHGRLVEAKVYALPLSTRVISQAEDAMLVITPSLEEANAYPTPACFLPDRREQSQAGQKTHEKRQSLTSLFDDATQKRRKFKGRGGERVAQAMASLDQPASQHGTVAETRNESQQQSHMPARLSRASTMPEIPQSEYARPASRSGTLANGKRSSLYHVESAISPHDSPTLSHTDDSFGNQNKAALTKIVMAGMRLYGLQQKKKTGKGAISQGPSTVLASEWASLAETEGDDEYKLVYHQTFKATTFAFRRQFSSQIIAQETMRDVVDRFLNLFCTDLIASTTSSDDSDLLGFGTHESGGSGAFDLPSVKIVSPSAPVSCSTPTIKKR